MASETGRANVGPRRGDARKGSTTSSFTVSRGGTDLLLTRSTAVPPRPTNLRGADKVPQVINPGAASVPDTDAGSMRLEDVTELPRWLVTASHGVWQATASGRSWVPYAVHHARTGGRPLTACGQFAVGWPMFWDMRFGEHHARACKGCLESVSNPSPRTS